MSQILYLNFKFTWESCFSWLVGWLVVLFTFSFNLATLSIAGSHTLMDRQLGISDTGYK